MIAYLQGELIRNNIDYIVILVNGIGYKVYICAKMQDELPKIGDEFELHTYNYVREDRIALYGFSTVEELELFEKLLDVSRIGPKVALNILSNTSVRDFKLALLNNDVSTLKEVKGIGKKTAKRLILELQEKVELDNILNDGNEEVDNNKISDASEALLSLGYKQGDVQRVINKLYREDNQLTVEDMIKKALIYLS